MQQYIIDSDVNKPQSVYTVKVLDILKTFLCGISFISHLGYQMKATTGIWLLLSQQ